MEKEKCLLSLFGTMKQNAKLAPLTELVASAGNPDTKRPLLFELCSGFLNKQKINVLNSVLVDHVLTIKKKDGKEYQANTLVTHLKMLFARFQKEGIMMKLSRDFNNFNGCLSAF